jgi:hypothetical protein
MNMDLGTFTEGVIELDPMTGRMVLRIQQEDGSNVFLDVQEAMTKYKGEAVRFILTPLSTVEKLTEMVESGQLSTEDLPDASKH